MQDYEDFLRNKKAPLRKRKQVTIFQEKSKVAPTELDSANGNTYEKSLQQTEETVKTLRVAAEKGDKEAYAKLIAMAKKSYFPSYMFTVIHHLALTINIQDLNQPVNKNYTYKDAFILAFVQSIQFAIKLYPEQYYKLYDVEPESAKIKIKNILLSQKGFESLIDKLNMHEEQRRKDQDTAKLKK
jgi:hypothetical protein